MLGLIVVEDFLYVQLMGEAFISHRLAVSALQHVVQTHAVTFWYSRLGYMADAVPDGVDPMTKSQAQRHKSGVDKVNSLFFARLKLHRLEHFTNVRVLLG